MKLNIERKVAVITGAGQGIGRATALTFAHEKANVVINDIDIDSANIVAEEAQSVGVQALAVKADVTEADQVKDMVTVILERFGRLDILVNNAGVFYIEGSPVIRKLFHESTEHDWPGELEIALYGVLNCTRSAVEPMIQQKSGAIVNIASDAGRAPSPKNALYGMGKGGVIAFSRNLASELGNFGIRVNCVCPGPTKTPRIEAYGSGDPSAVEFYQALEAMVKKTPLHRMGTSQEIANVVVFLASEASSFITGQTLSVNGGRIMP